jgi:hypothetical protein
VGNIACLTKNNGDEVACDEAPINPSCNAAYHGQTVENLTSSDALCNFGTISDFTATTTGRTWKCNGQTGTTPAQCSANKAEPTEQPHLRLRKYFFLEDGILSS